MPSSTPPSVPRSRSPSPASRTRRARCAARRPSCAESLVRPLVLHGHHERRDDVEGPRPPPPAAEWKNIIRFVSSIDGRVRMTVSPVVDVRAVAERTCDLACATMGACHGSCISSLIRSPGRRGGTAAPRPAGERARASGRSRTCREANPPPPRTEQPWQHAGRGHTPLRDRQHHRVGRAPLELAASPHRG